MESVPDSRFNSITININDTGFSSCNESHDNDSLAKTRWRCILNIRSSRLKILDEHIEPFRINDSHHRLEDVVSPLSMRQKLDLYKVL